MKTLFVKLNRLCIAITVAFCLTHCISPDGKNTNAETEQLRQEVVELHNAAMGRMGTIMRLKKELEARMNTADSIQITHSIQNLEEADEAMMIWMRGMKISLLEEEMANAPADTMSAANKAIYLQQEKEKLENLDQQMKDAISKAEQTLQH